MIPLNLMSGSNEADYVITGQWAKKAAEEAAAALEAENKKLRESLLHQEKLLSDILAAMKK